MKTLIAILVISAFNLAAQSDTPPAAKKKTAKTSVAAKTAVAPKPAAPVAQPITIPPDATPNSDGTYSYTDKAGKKWVYNKTPFGISKMQDMGGTGSAATPPAQQFVKAFDNGDSVRFERQSPFGTTKWEKKKSELTDEERALLQQQTPATKPE